ncbi:hypothetical protein JHFBIEKO_4425 [Methylobacterium mesophilicum]|uniref:hypothetical protein n=1 Tax=Methylobacterium mesophilicum TaxID=39956 RepID=UPI001EE3844F|nr:hypothetical protein [Methylobacterium mesophilicum]GJE23959.1 hypothetical protein JHFBIEKO_4425 [Methylobacterium mesophilicum]
MANYITHEPTELELRLTAEREAADAAARAAVQAERQRLYDAREAALKAARKPVPMTKTALEPNRVAAEALRAALDDAAWVALLRHFDVWDPGRFKASALFIAQGETAAARKAELVRGAQERAERQAAEHAAAQAALEARAAELAS